MNVDASALSALLIAAAAFVTAMGTLAQARSRAQRVEIRGRRKKDLATGRYINRLEQTLADRDIPLPKKPDDLVAAEEADWA